MSYTFSKKRRTTVQKSFSMREALRKIRQFLDEHEPALVFWLMTMWNAQGKAITYKELIAAIDAGSISWDILEEWTRDYEKFIKARMEPAWIEAMEAAAKEIERTHPGFLFAPDAAGVRAWCETMAAKFVTEVTQTQIEGIRAVILQATTMEHMTHDALAKVIRPLVGLNRPQAMANLRYYESLINGGLSEEQALEKALKYAARQHRQRGYLIARTELAFAYNQGSYEGTKQAQEAGLMGDVVKIWCTADDERVCKICGALEGKRIGMDEDFDINPKLSVTDNPTVRKVPPAHPRCRCTVLYEEISPPIAKPSEETT